jgi:CheY-like chemotaxis protein
MTKPLILFVDDEPNVLNGLKRFCRSQRHVWEMQFVDGGEAALEALAKRPADVVVSDMRMPGVNGADLFEQISQRWPGIIRIMLSGEAEPDQTMRTVGRSHRFLAKPCDPNALIHAIEAPLQMRETLGLHDPSLKSSYLERLQTPPQIFERLQILLEQDEVSEKDIASLVMTDAALSARILQLANSAYFGRPVPTCNIAKAVETIGSNRIAKLLELQRLGNHESTIASQFDNASIREARQFGIVCCEYFDQHDFSRDQQDLIFAAGLFHGLGQGENDGASSSSAQSIPAYMVTLLGLPDKLADVMTKLIGKIPPHLEIQSRLDHIQSAIEQPKSPAV